MLFFRIIVSALSHYGNNSSYGVWKNDFISPYMRWIIQELKLSICYRNTSISFINLSKTENLIIVM